MKHVERTRTLQDQMVAIAAEMYAHGFITGLSGNLSARLPDGKILVTPAGAHKGSLSPETLLTVDLEGHILSNPEKMLATSELPMHLEVYRQRLDVGAAIHAHPVTCIALSLVGITLEKPYIPEAVVLLGDVPTTAYATPSSDENRQAISELIREHDALILAHHGSLTVGRDLREAYVRLETLEHTAQIVALAHQLGEPRQLSSEAVRKLDQDRS
jgi:L-fuculose-phosphate aldolase